MSNTEFKKAFDDVSPDMYMQTRILANIKEKRKKRLPLKAALSGVLAVAIVAGCAGGMHYKNLNTYIDRPFSVMVVNASDDLIISEEIAEDKLIFPSLHIGVEKEPDGEGGYNYNTYSDDETGLGVVGDDIDYVQYQSLNGSLMYQDVLKTWYDMENGGFYQVIIPVADEDVKEINAVINESKWNPEQTALKKYMENHDTSKYFGKYNPDDDYWVYFGKYCDYIGLENDSEDYAFFLYNTENYEEDYIQDTWDEDLSEITVKMYPLSEKGTSALTEEEKKTLGNISYFPDGASNALSENPQMKLSELPEDEITIIVTFKDGKKAKKVITVSFDDNGDAVFAYKK